MLEGDACVPIPTMPTTCGPGTKLEDNTCIVDRSAPGPVTGLRATVNGSAIDLAWTAGTDAVSTLLVRTVAGAYDEPAPGVTYTAGMTLPGGSTVVSAGAATTASDAITAPGRYSYLTWAQNASGNYGFARESSVVAPLPAQMGAVTLDIAATTATVTTQPANVALAVTNLAFDADTGEATFDLGATNQTAGHLFNLKAIVRSQSVGAIATPSGHADNGDAFITLGQGARLPALVSTQTVTLSGIGATDTVTLDLQLVESGLAIVGGNGVDTAGGPAFSADLPETSGNRNQASYTGGFPSASGRYFYLTTRWHPTLFRVDTASGAVASVSPFAGGNAGCTVFGPDGYAYSSYQLVTHRSRDGYGLGIAKIDPISLTVVAKAELTAGQASIAKGCAMHGDRLAVTYGEDVYFVDLAAMEFIDVDPTTAMQIDPVEVGATETLRALVFSPAGTTLYASATKGDPAIYAIDASTYAVSTYHTATSPYAKSLTIDAAGTLWWAGDDGLYSFDGTTESQVASPTHEITNLIALDGTKALVAGNAASFVIDLTDGTVSREGTLDNNRLGHSGVLFATP